MSSTAPHPGIPDILGKDLNVIFCGINPGMRSAVLRQHFAGRGNRFWPVLHKSGFTPHLVSPQNARSILDYHCGITSAVDRPTVAASELKLSDFTVSRPGLERKIERYAPRYIAFLGKAACSAVFDPRELTWGPQAKRFGGAIAWLLPNPSGLNCAFTFATLTKLYGELFQAVARGEKSAMRTGRDPRVPRRITDSSPAETLRSSVRQ
jgi:double-stranded uracil-DNA glycosylase